MARKKKDPNKPGRLSQIRQAYSMTKKSQPLIGLVLIGVFLLVLGVFLGIGVALGNPWTFGILGFAVAMLATVFVFGRRAEKAALAQVSDQPGAAAAVLQTLRRGWIVTPAVAVTRNSDLVHRVVGKCGVVLVGEGSPTRVVNLLAAEKKKTARVVGDSPVTELVVGDGEGQVPLRKLTRRIMKLPRPLRGADVTDLNNRMRAINAMNSPLPMPKGPLPKGVKLPKAPKA